MKPQEITLKDGSVYLVRRFVIPRNRICNIYLHTFLQSDDDRAMHDHPWWSVSFLLSGKLIEHYWPSSVRKIRLFVPVFRRSTHVHRLELVGKTATTLFITGPKIRSWGFWCPDPDPETHVGYRWVHWQKYHDNGGCE